MQSITIPQNDKGYYLNFTVTDSAAAAYDLTDYTITLKVFRSGSTTLEMSGACPIVVAASGTCRYLIVAADFPTPGTFMGELELTKTGVIESTELFTVIITNSA